MLKKWKQFMMKIIYYRHIFSFKSEMRHQNFIEYFKRGYFKGWGKIWSFACSFPGLSRSDGNRKGFNY